MTILKDAYLCRQHVRLAGNFIHVVLCLALLNSFNVNVGESVSPLTESCFYSLIAFSPFCHLLCLSCPGGFYVVSISVSVVIIIAGPPTLSLPLSLPFHSNFKRHKYHVAIPVFIFAIFCLFIEPVAGSECNFLH